MTEQNDRGHKGIAEIQRSIPQEQRKEGHNNEKRILVEAEQQLEVIRAEKSDWKRDKPSKSENIDWK